MSIARATRFAGCKVGVWFAVMLLLTMALGSAWADDQAKVAAARASLNKAVPITMDSPKLAPYVDALDTPPVAVPVSRSSTTDYYRIRAVGFTQKLHRDLPPTHLWGYDDGNGPTFPGATIVATKDRAVQVKWINNLPPVGHSLLPVDDTLLPMRTNGADNRMVVHVHGAKVPAASDGLPWQDFAPGGSLVDTYPNHMTARLMWYHDHADGLTRLNTQAGLAGGYLLTDSVEAGLNLPGPIGSPYDVPLILTNKTFRANGNLWYPRYYPDPTVPAPVPSCVPEFFGDTNLVNGKVWPYLDVQPRKYRFRILNAASARFYRMSLRVLSATGKIASSVLITQIGNEGGFLPAPVIINHSAATGGNGGQLMLAPAERADVIIDFSRYAGKKIVLTNDAPAPFPSGTSPDPNLAGTVGQIMQFRVNDDPADPVDTSSVPSVLTSIPDLERLPWDVTRNLGLWESLDQFGRLIQRLGTAGDGIGGQPMMDPVSETLKLGTIEKWNIVNTTMDVHPIHIHEFNCQVISRQAVNVGYYIKTGNLKFTGPAHDPLPNEQGAWKETFQCPPNTVTTILIDAREGFPGKYVWHCHILEHEEHDMMRPFIVIP